MKRTTLIGITILADMTATLIFALILYRNQGNENLFSEPLLYVVLGLFIVTPILVLIYVRLGAAASDADLLQNGLSARAVVLSAGEIGGQSKDGLAQVSLRLRVDLPDGGSYEAKTRAAVSPLSLQPYREGMAVMVRCDPKNRARVVIDSGPIAPASATQTVSSAANAEGQFSQPLVVSQSKYSANTVEALPPTIQKMIQAVFVDGDHNGVPDIMEQAGGQGDMIVNLRDADGMPADPQARIAKLEKLRAAGLITDAVFETLKAKLLAGGGPGAG